MKKYIGLLIVFLMVFVLGNNLAQAKDGDDDSSDDVRIETSGKIEVETEDDDSDDDAKVKREESKKLLEAKREEIKKQIEAVREEAKTRMEALRESIKNEKDAVKAKVKEMRIVGREKALERFDNAVERITEWQIKVEAKIAELEARGVAVADAKGFLATSETKLTAAKNKIVEINAVLAVSIDELTAESRTKLRTLAGETQTLVVEAHKALRDAVKSLKDAVKIKIEADAKVEVETGDDDNE